MEGRIRVYAFSHTRIAALSREEVKLSKVVSRFILVRENFTTLDSDAILSGTPTKTAGFMPVVFVFCTERVRTLLKKARLSRSALFNHCFFTDNDRL
jgi:hypothetical protein